ncbi:MAG: hypothetical protein H0U82_06740 [Actinobacteria bacterium]|nr:hypothetical protein [Actinomycetota bacterium]
MARRVVMGIGFVACVLVLVHLAGAPAAMASEGAAADDGEARVEKRCSRGSTAELRLRVRGREIRVEFEIDVERPGGTWRVILLHERRTAFRGTLRPGDSGTIRLRRTVPNWFGTDSFTVRATASRGETCRATAVV